MTLTRRRKRHCTNKSRSDREKMFSKRFIAAIVSSHVKLSSFLSYKISNSARVARMIQRKMYRARGKYYRGKCTHQDRNLRYSWRSISIDSSSRSHSIDALHWCEAIRDRTMIVSHNEPTAWAVESGGGGPRSQDKLYPRSYRSAVSEVSTCTREQRNI